MVCRSNRGARSSPLKPAASVEAPGRRSNAGPTKAKSASINSPDDVLLTLGGTRIFKTVIDDNTAAYVDRRAAEMVSCSLGNILWQHFVDDPEPTSSPKTPDMKKKVSIDEKLNTQHLFSDDAIAASNSSPRMLGDTPYASRAANLAKQVTNETDRKLDFQSKQFNCTSTIRDDNNNAVVDEGTDKLVPPAAFPEMLYGQIPGGSPSTITAYHLPVAKIDVSALVKKPSGILLRKVPDAKAPFNPVVNVCYKGLYFSIFMDTTTIPVPGDFEDELECKMALVYRIAKEAHDASRQKSHFKAGQKFNNWKRLLNSREGYRKALDPLVHAALKAELNIPAHCAFGKQTEYNITLMHMLERTDGILLQLVSFAGEPLLIRRSPDKLPERMQAAHNIERFIEKGIRPSSVEQIIGIYENLHPQQVIILERTPSGRVLKVRVAGRKGTYACHVMAGPNSLLKLQQLRAYHEISQSGITTEMLPVPQIHFIVTREPDSDELPSPMEQEVRNRAGMDAKETSSDTNLDKNVVAFLVDWVEPYQPANERYAIRTLGDFKKSKEYKAMDRTTQRRKELYWQSFLLPRAKLLAGILDRDDFIGVCCDVLSDFSNVLLGNEKSPANPKTKYWITLSLDEAMAEKSPMAHIAVQYPGSDSWLPLET